MRSENYWQHKLSLYLHDPVDKPFDIRGHEGRADKIADLLSQSSPDKSEYQMADHIASGLTRAALPGYSENKNENGAVNFLENSELTHPLVSSKVKINIPDDVSAEKIYDDVIKILKKDIGIGLSKEQLDKLKKESEDRAPLNAFFKGYTGDEGKEGVEIWNKALYYYLFFAFKKRLRQENAGGIGALWDMIPADTRMPDHSLWNHCALTSAIGSCMATDPEKDVSLAVFSITPVQAFISKARKLSDFWTGSVILSYLSFIGIKYIADNYGPDHIIYPSLHDQSLVEEWLERDFHLGDFIKETDKEIKKISEKSKTIASFPNKFVFLCPSFRAKKICVEISGAVQKEWLRISAIVRDMAAGDLDAGDKMKELFDYQVSDYWQYSYSALKLINPGEAHYLSEFIGEGKWKSEADTIGDFSEKYKNNSARLYGATHTLAQSLLAAGKMKPDRIRKPQSGKKCPLCGEHEVLHDFKESGNTNAKDYKKHIDEFWAKMKNVQRDRIKEDEQLCAVCLIKRLLPMAIKNTKDPREILMNTFKRGEGFPATTEIAAQSYLDLLIKNDVIKEEERKDCVEKLHEAEDKVEKPKFVKDAEKIAIKFYERDKYYAVLLMDGDKMGDLINGVTISAKWRDVIHPELEKRFKDENFGKEEILKKHKYLNEKRLLNPALHASISDALNSFARFSVAPVVEDKGGKLVYAGGDDVCAIAPLDKVFEMAKDIRRAYNMAFVKYEKHGAEEIKEQTDIPLKMGMHLGKNEKISISAAIVIAHHKEPLRNVLKDAHYVLDNKAKKETGRDAVAIRLKKRSGGDRDFCVKWDDHNPFDESETLLSSFDKITKNVSDALLSSSLIYRIGNMKDAVNAVFEVEPEEENKKDKILKLFEYEIGHSGLRISEGRKKEQAKRLAGLCLAKEGEFKYEPAIIARFLAVPAGRKKEGDDE